MIGLDDIFKFWDKVDRLTPDKCWRFKGRDFKGFAPIRISYFIHHQVDPGFTKVVQTCKNVACVNPFHLDLWTPRVEPALEVPVDQTLLGLFEALDDTPVIREDFVRPPIGYPGAKNRSLDKLLPHLPYRNTYVEPFGGSGAVMFARKPSPLEVYNDRFGGITSFYRCLRDRKMMERLYDLADLTVHSREEFITCKLTWEQEEDDVLRAFKWYYQHQVSFGNQARHFGRATSGNAQIGARVRNNIQFFEKVHHRLHNVQIENLDWRIMFKDYDSPDTVWYLDPPYVKYSKGMYKHEFTKADHIELCERISKLEGFVALSGYGDKETFEIYNRYQWDDMHEWEARTSMVGLAFTDTNNLQKHEATIKRDSAREVLYIREAKE